MIGRLPKRAQPTVEQAKSKQLAQYVRSRVTIFIEFGGSCFSDVVFGAKGPALDSP
jgi:hypothetical protein